MIDPSQTIQLSEEFSDEQLLAICEVADIIACECPSYLAKLLHDVREFRRYTHECVEHFPEDTAVHQWLNSRAQEVETLLSRTILEFLNKEKLLESNNQLNLNRLAQRTHEIVLKQTA